MGTQDIGVVLRLNNVCQRFANYMTTKAASATNEVALRNNPHITLIHISNLNEEAQDGIRQTFLEFGNRNNNICIALPVKAIKATGGSSEEGFKWLDLQFDTLIPLANLREEAVDIFCPLHNGTLSRMFDDPSNFAEGSQALYDIEKCGVTFSSYIPHITAWYVNLPEVSKSTLLEEVASLIEHGADSLTCYAAEIALVELGRNGNAAEIIEHIPLCIGNYYL